MDATRGLQRGVLSIALVAMGGCHERPVPTFAGAPVYGEGTHFSVIGDLQRTLPEEHMFMRRETNDAERAQMLPEIIRRHPAFVVMLGDLVSLGGSREQWHEFDERAGDVLRTGTPVFPVPGNHEYMLGGRRNLENYFARFPHLAHNRWYEHRYGPLALVFVDSNRADLSAIDRVTQQHWYEETLLRLDDDDTVVGIFVFLHHAPFTNSSLVGDDTFVKESFVEPFIERKKTLAMITGHVHSYEHFERGTKHFIVSGGGGGPRQTLLENGRRHPDDRYCGPSLRHFNYVELSLGASGVRALVVGLPKGSDSFCEMDAFELPWQPGTETLAARPKRPPESLEGLPRCEPVVACGSPAR